MANLHRGEIAAVIDGREHRLCLTLGALAELETSFAVNSLPALVAQLSKGVLTSRQVCAIIAAGLHGGGSTLSLQEVASMHFEDGASGMTDIVARLLAATFPASGIAENTAGPVTPNPL
ncbi:MAG: gene transfer agent family protein [Nitratireductor sp.]